MSTTSTKSSRKKSSSNSAPAKKASDERSADSPETSELTWRISSLSILAVGAFLRLYNLGLVPLHHDEGVNGNFLVTLVREGKYIYNPENYHGPTLYFFSAVIPWLARFFGGKAFGDNYGLTTFNIRFVTAAFGIGTIWLALLLRKRIGTIGALSAAGLIAVSPGAVYLSRYFIHESLFVFFTLGIVVAALKYYDTGQAAYLILASISGALMVATKETWIINGPVLLIALIMTGAYFRVREKVDGNESEGSLGERWRQMLERFGGPVPLATVALVAFAVFILVNVLFYSSFFTNYPKGVSDAMQTLNMWRHRTQEHYHPPYQYLYWLLQEEAIVVILGGLGGLIAVVWAKSRLALFLSLWSFGLLAAYSIVGYKTPWISLNFIVPLALVSGYALEVAFQKLREFGQPRLFIMLAVLIAAPCIYQMYQLNFVHYDDDAYPYVYAHTRRELLQMLDEIDRVTKRMGTGTDTGIALVSPDYWPLPWYFRDYKKVGYYQQIVATNEPIIIGSTAQEEQLKETYGDRYVLVVSGKDDGAYALRPGVDLLLYVRKDVAK
ncbi:MAG TPA: flippase activity-associated protein Agl23 [Pyrinomonadaceae bacterium]|nr:flippase activity-associated protein Agl23 [Pyrinomonadaceae bacterium]